MATVISLEHSTPRPMCPLLSGVATDALNLVSCPAWVCFCTGIIIKKNPSSWRDTPGIIVISQWSRIPWWAGRKDRYPPGTWPSCPWPDGPAWCWASTSCPQPCLCELCHSCLGSDATAEASAEPTVASPARESTWSSAIWCFSEEVPYLENELYAKRHHLCLIPLLLMLQTYFLLMCIKVTLGWGGTDLLAKPVLFFHSKKIQNRITPSWNTIFNDEGQLNIKVHSIKLERELIGTFFFFEMMQFDLLC